MRTIIRPLIPFIIVYITARPSLQAQQNKPVFKTKEELQQPFQVKQPSSDILQLREKILSGTAKTSEMTRVMLSEAGHADGAIMQVQSADKANSAVSVNNARSQAVAGTPVAPIFHLIKDINTATSSSPYNLNYNNYFDQHFAVVNDISYFWADDGIHGNELWRSDGTKAGTYLVKDITPGEAATEQTQIVAVNNKIYFRAVGPDQLWCSDGTEAGTKLVTTLPNTGGNQIFYFFAGGNNLFFVSSSPGGILNQLWKSDGTSAGTVLVYDAGFQNPGFGISHLAFANGILYFTNATQLNGCELWRSDGTPAGTHMVKDINPGNTDFYDQGPDNLTTYNDRLYFTERDGLNRKLWVADALGNDARPAPGYNGITFPYNSGYQFANTPFIVSNNFMYFQGFSSATGNELYKYDIIHGETLVMDITPGAAGTTFADNSAIADVNNTLYFGTVNTNNQYELWKTKGKGSSTTHIKQFQSNKPFYSFCNANGTLLFQGFDSIYDVELWKSDGTEAGTVVLKDINNGPVSSSPNIFTHINNKKILFQAYTTLNGMELWLTNGTEAGTKLVKDINKTTTDGSSAGGYQMIIGTPTGVIFSAYQKEFGGELYKSDGTAAGTVLINDANPGDYGSVFRNFKRFNNTTYFVAGPDPANGNAYSIYKTDGTAAGTIKIVSSNDNIDNYIVTENGLVFYAKYINANAVYELWRTDGTSSGNIPLTSGLYGASNLMAAAGNTVYFSSGDVTHGYELWKTNGTVVSTKMVKDINPGAGSSSPFSLFAYKGYVFFGAYDGVTTAFWRSNGKADGTIKVKDINPATAYADNINDYFCISDSTLYLVATTDSYGFELWKTNGAANSTKLVKDIYPGYIGSYAGYLRNMNGILYFSASDDIHGQELWKTDGTEAGTKMIKDVTEGSAGSYYDKAVIAGGKLYFSLSDVLWVSDGTEAGTQQVIDAGLTGVRNIQTLTGTTDKLFIGAYNYKYGNELIVGDLTTSTFKATRNDAAIVVTKFDAKVYPNPVQSSAQLAVSGDIKKFSVTIADVNGKSIWQQMFNDISRINLPVEKLSGGIYFVTVSTDSGKKIVKLIKQ